MRGSSVGGAARRLELYPKALGIFATGQGGEVLTGAWSGDALAAFDEEQRTVGGALDQAGT